MDFGELFQRFWWLIFPVLSMVWGMVDLAAKHKRARHGMDLIKSYIDQGKEPPPELLRFLSVQTDGNCSKSREYSFVPVFLFAALSAGFIWAPFMPGMDLEPRQVWALHLVAMIFGALCLGLLVAALRRNRNQDRP